MRQLYLDIIEGTQDPCALTNAQLDELARKISADEFRLVQIIIKATC